MSDESDFDEYFKEVLEPLTEPMKSIEEINKVEDFFRLNFSTHFNEHNDRVCYAVDCYDAMVQFANSQTTNHLKSYSEDEVLELLKQFNKDAPDYGYGIEYLIEWFKKHKK